MSVDSADLAATWQAGQQGQGASFYSIAITPPATFTPNPVPYNIPIPAIDCLWMPRIYDAALGGSDMQNGNCRGTIGKTSSEFFGVNPFSETDIDGNENSSEAVFSLQFNSSNSPWFVWGKGGLFTQKWGPSSPNQKWQPAFVQGAMKSITGPISVLNCKFYSAATYFDASGTGHSSQTPIILYASVGYSFSVEDGFNEITDLTGISAGDPNIAASRIMSFGGYQTPQMNTAQRAGLAAINKAAL